MPAPRANFPADTIADLLGITPRRLQQLAAEEFVPRSERGLYPLVGSVQGYIRSLKQSLSARRAFKHRPPIELSRDAARASAAVLAVLEGIEARCMAADGPVTPTREAITDAELRALYAHARAAARASSLLHEAAKRDLRAPPETDVAVPPAGA